MMRISNNINQETFFFRRTAFGRRAISPEAKIREEEEVKEGAQGGRVLAFAKSN